jgi:hypothetical protein
MFKSSRSGDLKAMKKTMNLATKGQHDFMKNFKRRDPEGRFILNNVLLNGHLPMLDYILNEHAEQHIGLNLTLDGNLTVLHQALTQAAFNNKDNKEDPLDKFSKMFHLLTKHANNLSGDKWNYQIGAKDRLGRTVLHLAA